MALGPIWSMDVLGYLFVPCCCNALPQGLSRGLEPKWKIV